MRHVVGVRGDSWVSNDRYDEDMAKAARMNIQALDNADDDFKRETTMKYWPFDDYAEKESVECGHHGAPRCLTVHHGAHSWSGKMSTIGER